MRYLMTHSLLSSWLYAMKGSSFEDATTERDAHAEFLQVLRKEPTPTTPAMQKGIDFEDLVTAIIKNDQEGMKMNPQWFDAACKVAEIIGDGLLQYRARKTITVSGMEFVLYGRLDALSAGVIYDIKFTSSSYEVGKYIDSTQHPTYMELVPEAHEFVYLVSNGTQVWTTDRYRRDEVRDIRTVIAAFIDWLNANDLMAVYTEYWQAA